MEHDVLSVDTALCHNRNKIADLTYMNKAIRFTDSSLKPNNVSDLCKPVGKERLAVGPLKNILESPTFVIVYHEKPRRLVHSF